MNKNKPYSASRAILPALALAATLTMSASAQAELTFNFLFSSSPTDAFNADPNAAAERQAVITAGNLFSQMFATHFTNTATISLDVTGLNDPNTNTLMSAGSYGLSSALPGFGNNDLVRQAALGNNLLPGSTLGVVNVNFGYLWELNPNTPAVASGGSATPTFDFYAAFNHEITHALGFASGIDFAGTDGSGNGQTTAGTWTKFDQFLTNSVGLDLINHSTLTTNQAVYDLAKSGPLAGISFNGVNAVAANGGQSVKIYTPSDYQPGSSGSHLDSDVYVGSMMVPGRDYGPQEARNYSAVEIGIMTDLGFTAVTAVPEAGTLGMMLAGLFGVGAVARRRKAAL